MENQTRFDLNAAIENWRAELAVQAGLTADNRRELETHLRDAIAGFQQRGLNDEESFWLARRRVGQPQQLGEEFVKADPISIWRERAFWMTLAVLLFWLWNGSTSIFANMVAQSLNGWAEPDAGWSLLSLNLTVTLIRVLPIYGLALLMAKGRVNANSALLSFFRSRSRLAIVTGVWSVINFMVWVATRTSHYTLSSSLIWGNLFYSLSFPLVLVVLLIWLMPARLRAKPKHA